MTKLKTTLTTAFALLIFANITTAQALRASYTQPVAEPLSVKYLGDDANYLFFKVTLQSTDPRMASFEIEDKTEGQLYTSRMKENVKSTTIKIEKTQADQTLNFKLAVGRKVYAKSFSVNTSQVETTTVSEGDITKL